MVDKFYYFVSGDLVRKCTMRESPNDDDIVYIRFLDEEDRGLIFEHIVFRSSLYEELAEAELVADFVRDLNKGFTRVPRVPAKFLKEHKTELLEIQDRLFKELKNLHSVSFTYNGDHITVECYHKEIPMETLGCFAFLLPDFSNKDSVIEDLIEWWIGSDTPSNIKDIKRIVAEYNEYGCD